MLLYDVDFSVDDNQNQMYSSASTDSKNQEIRTMEDRPTPDPVQEKEDSNWLVDNDDNQEENASVSNEIRILEKETNLDTTKPNKKSAAKSQGKKQEQNKQKKKIKGKESFQTASANKEKENRKEKQSSLKGISEKIIFCKQAL